MHGAGLFAGHKAAGGRRRVVVGHGWGRSEGARGHLSRWEALWGSETTGLGPREPVLKFGSIPSRLCEFVQVSPSLGLRTWPYQPVYTSGLLP